MVYRVIIDFIMNVGIILSASVVYTLLPKKQFELKGWHRYVYGVVISLIAVIIMAKPYVIMPGIQFDARSLVVGISAMFLGMIPTLIATAVASAYRIIMGGDGAIVGVMVVLSSAIIGTIWRKLYYWKLRDNKRKRYLNLYITGLLIHAAYLACLVFLPGGKFLEVFNEVYIPLLIVYPIGLFLLGLVLFSQYDKLKFLRELEETKDRVYTYVEEAPYGIFIMDSEGNFLDANKEAMAMTGYDSREILSMSMASITSQDNEEDKKNSFKRLVETGTLDINKRFITKDKGIRTWNVKAVRLNEARYVGFANDITEQVELEEKNRLLEATMRNQQKLESIGTLAGGVAHEINNPINGIMNYGQLILDSPVDDREINEYATEIIYESNRIADIVKNLLAFSRHDENEPMYCDIRKLLEHTMTLIKTVMKNDQIKMGIMIDDNLPDLICRGQQIQQVLMNLLTNARDVLNKKYPGYHENKKISVSCKKELHEGKRYIAIRVRDNGIGIKKDIADKVFDPFFTTKGRDSGTGLGLAISYGIVKDHNGEIGYTTEPEEFTEFFILLPAEID